MKTSRVQVTCSKCGRIRLINNGYYAKRLLSNKIRNVCPSCSAKEISEEKKKKKKTNKGILTCPKCGRSRKVGYAYYVSCKKQVYAPLCRKCSRKNMPKYKTHKITSDVTNKRTSKDNIVIVCYSCGKKIEINKLYYKSCLAQNKQPTCIACEKIGDKNSHEFENIPKIEMYGCTLIESKHNRCEKGYKCEHYIECVDATSKLFWGGWECKSGKKEEVKVA